MNIHSLRIKTCYNIASSGLYYKRIMIVIDSPSVVSKWRSKLEHHLLTIIIDDAS
jgi:hypothetical protein